LIALVEIAIPVPASVPGGDRAYGTYGSYVFVEDRSVKEAQNYAIVRFTLIERVPS
jgi:hypothetical protein